MRLLVEAPDDLPDGALERLAAALGVGHDDVTLLPDGVRLGPGGPCPEKVEELRRLLVAHLGPEAGLWVLAVSPLPGCASSE